MLILVVCKERLTGYALKRSIQKSARAVSAGADVRCFRSPLEALRCAEERPADVAFLETELPQMHGLILAKKLQRLNPKVNLIFVSAGSDYSAQAWSLHASDYLLKPVRQAQVADALTNLRHGTV